MLNKNEAQMRRAAQDQEWQSRLKNQSPYYPDVIFAERTEGTWYISTLIRISRGGTWYKVHVFEFHKVNKDVPELTYKVDLLQGLMKAAHQIHHHFKIKTSKDGQNDLKFDFEQDSIQLSEGERLDRELGYKNHS